MATTVPGDVRSRAVFTAAFWIICFGLLATLLYFYGLHSYWGNADLVRGLLQGEDMARGNVLLNHWYSGADNFLSIDLIFFALAILIVGEKVMLLHLISCLIWATLIFVGGYIAALGLTRWARLWAMLTVFVVLGLPSPLLAQALSQTMVHVGTCLFVLLAFIALRSGRFGWGWFFAVVLLAAATFGDPLAVAFGLAPAFAVGVLESIRKRDWRRGVATSSAPIVALLAAGSLRLVADVLGTFNIYSNAPLATSSGMLQNLHALFPDVASLLGVGASLRTSAVPWELEIFRSSGLAVVMLGVVVAVWYLLRGVLSGRGRSHVPGLADRGEASFRLSDFLVLAVLGDVAIYVTLGLYETALHYLTPAIIFAAILGAMLLGRFMQQLSSRRARRALMAAAVLIAGCCASSVAIIMSDAIPTSPYSDVGTFLAAHHLYKGVGDYWTSAPISVYSGGKVTVRQVIPYYTGGLQPYTVLSKTTWYTGTFQFLIYSLNESAYGSPQHYGERILESVDYPFSKVAQTYTYRSFVIVAWKRPQTMSELEYPQNASFANIKGHALPGLPQSNWPKLSGEPGAQLPLFAAAGQRLSTHGLSGQYEVSIFNFYSASAETNFYENKDLAMSYVIPAGAALSPLAGSTGVVGASEAFNLIECGSSSSVEPGNTCSDSVTKPYSAGVITVVERGSTVSVITYSANGQSTAPPPGELAKNVTVAKSVISLLTSAGIN
jgi:hypothetical protein